MRVIRYVRRVLGEIIGSPRLNRLATRWTGGAFSVTPTHDWGQADYAFWDRARWCKAQGLELAGLFLKPLASKLTAWVLGLQPTLVYDNPRTQDKVNDWMSAQYPAILRGYEESLNLGDAYLVVNADMTVTVLPPHVVEPIVDEGDYATILGWRVTEVHAHPTRVGDTMQIVDEYTAKQRVRRVSRNGVLQSTKTYPNLIGRVPVVHIANNVGSDERFGHPEGEALLSALQQYGVLFAAAIAGNKRQGRPTPVFEEMGTVDEVQKFWEQFGTKRTRQMPDGTTQTYTELDFDADNVLTLFGNAKFKWAQPGSFTGDTQTLLGLLFYLVLQHSEVPEFIWGNAISSSHASAEAQLPPFVKAIEKRRGQCLRWLTELAGIAAAYLALWERGVKAALVPEFRWEKLTQDDERLTLDAIRMALEKGLLDDETALSLMPLDVENPAEIIQKAREEAQQQEDEYARRQESLFSRMENERAARSDAAQADGGDAPETGDVDEIWTKALEGMA